MVDAVAVSIVALAIAGIGAGAWRSAGRESGRAGLAVLAGIGIPALAVLGVMGGLATGPLPVVVAGLAAAALAAGAARPAVTARLRAPRAPAAVPSPPRLQVVPAETPPAAERHAA
ncbi:MAG: hypothetical protein IT200_06810 [Thermoleophilia bacterium]|nr:hypothetical protein [Thermoleophilia bacterium]